jgi:hypothetical protein
MRRTVPLAVVGWLAAAVAATATGVVAVTLIGQGLSGPQTAVPLTEAEVASALASPPPTRATPTAPPSRPRGQARSLTTPCGTVTATCSGGLATLLSWAPAQGYAVGEVGAGPDDSPKVRFERGERRIEVRVRCGAGGPYTEVKED